MLNCYVFDDYLHMNSHLVRGSDEGVKIPEMNGPPQTTTQHNSYDACCHCIYCFNIYIFVKYWGKKKGKISHEQIMWLNWCKKKKKMHKLSMFFFKNFNNNANLSEKEKKLEIYNWVR